MVDRSSNPFLVLGLELRTEFQAQLLAHATGWPSVSGLSAADWQELHSLEALAQQIDCIGNDYIVLAQWLMSGFMPSTAPVATAAPEPSWPETGRSISSPWFNPAQRRVSRAPRLAYPPDPPPARMLAPGPLSPASAVPTALPGVMESSARVAEAYSDLDQAARTAATAAAPPRLSAAPVVPNSQPDTGPQDNQPNPFASPPADTNRLGSAQATPDSDRVLRTDPGVDTRSPGPATASQGLRRLAVQTSRDAGPTVRSTAANPLSATRQGALPHDGATLAEPARTAAPALVPPTSTEPPQAFAHPSADSLAEPAQPFARPEQHSPATNVGQVPTAAAQPNQPIRGLSDLARTLAATPFTLNDEPAEPAPASPSATTDQHETDRRAASDTATAWNAARRIGPAASEHANAPGAEPQLFAPAPAVSRPTAPATSKHANAPGAEPQLFAPAPAVSRPTAPATSKHANAPGAEPQLFAPTPSVSQPATAVAAYSPNAAATTTAADHLPSPASVQPAAAAYTRPADPATSPAQSVSNAAATPPAAPAYTWPADSATSPVQSVPNAAATPPAAAAYTWPADPATSPVQSVPNAAATLPATPLPTPAEGSSGSVPALRRVRRNSPPETTSALDLQDALAPELAMAPPTPAGHAVADVPLLPQQAPLAPSAAAPPSARLETTVPPSAVHTGQSLRPSASGNDPSPSTPSGQSVNLGSRAVAPLPTVSPAAPDPRSTDLAQPQGPGLFIAARDASAVQTLPSPKVRGLGDLARALATAPPAAEAPGQRLAPPAAEAPGQRLAPPAAEAPGQRLAPPAPSHAPASTVAPKQAQPRAAQPAAPLRLAAPAASERPGPAGAAAVAPVLPVANTPAWETAETDPPTDSSVARSGPGPDRLFTHPDLLAASAGSNAYLAEWPTPDPELPATAYPAPSSQATHDGALPARAESRTAAPGWLSANARSSGATQQPVEQHEEIAPPHRATAVAAVELRQGVRSPGTADYDIAPVQRQEVLGADAPANEHRHADQAELPVAEVRSETIQPADARDIDLDLILEALAQEIQREYKRFYGD